MEGKPDLERRPEYYHPYASNVDKIVQKGKSLSALLTDDKDSKKKVDKFLQRYNGNKEDYLYLPMVGKNNDMALVIDNVTGLPIDGIAVDPW